MQIDDLLSNGMVRRWSLVDGQARCVEDAIGANDAGAVPALQKNAAVRVIVGAVEVYEAAAALIARGEPDNGQPRQIPDPDAVRPEDAPDDWAAPLIDNPAWSLLPRTVETIGQDGEPQTVPEPRWQAYDDAEAEIATASETTKALARWRAAEAGHGSPEESVAEDEAEAEGAPWEADRAAVLAALETEAAKPLVVDPRPIDDEISYRQFAMAANSLGLMTDAEVEAFLSTKEIPQMLLSAIAKLPAPMRNPAKWAIMGSSIFRRSNPATAALMGHVEVPQNFSSAAALRDAIWRLGATFA